MYVCHPPLPSQQALPQCHMAVMWADVANKTKYKLKKEDNRSKRKQIPTHPGYTPWLKNTKNENRRN